MRILTICNLFLTIFVFKTSLASPFESSDVNNEQLRWILDRFDRLENEISGLKGIIGELKQKLEKFESSGSPTKSDAEAPKKENSSAGSLSAVPAAAISGPTSCQDLLDSNTAATPTNGFHIVGNPTTSRMTMVNCNFGTEVLQTFIGNLDTKTKEVNFFVQRTTPFSAPDAVVPFDSEQLNIGNAMNIRSGVFTAPVSGTYHFSFSGIKDGTANSLKIELRLNFLIRVGLAYATNLDSFLGLSTINTSLELKAGDTIVLFKVGAGTLYDSAADQFTHFTGWLEQEDLTISPI